MDYGWATTLGETIVQLARRIGDYLPNLLAAAALVLAGWVVAWLLRGLVARLLARLEWLTRTGAVQSGVRRLGLERPVSDIAARIVFWVVFLLFLTAATEALRLPVLATWLSGVSDYLPRVLVAGLIVLAGLLAGGLARNAVAAAATATGVAYGGLLGRAAQAAIALIAIVTAVDQLGIDSRFLTLTITVVLGSVTGGTALAFGLGARTAVSNIVAAHYLRQTYRIGQTVRVDGVQGRILEITPTAVVLDAPEGRTLVPAKAFGESVSVLVATGEPGGR